ncbi:diacylglycerol kinase theta-like protein [Lates japonicus]|uniref:diacylglycerol kinase (ATP) n=1 Tax=Lates japonicus TaxID=270547 RepID=A0AAD3N7Q9_LATJO|nr:diacylglycerol kinase theta-like protein [Lates japonicus]
MADSGWARAADPDTADGRTASPPTVKKRAQQSPGLRPKYQSSAPGHCFKKVTLTKPTYCHSCSDFIWGLIGFLCEDNSDNVDSSATVSKDSQTTAPESGKQFLKVFDGDDAVKRSYFRLVSTCRATRNEEVVEAALRTFYLPDEPQDFELHEISGLQRLHSDDILNRNGGPDNRGSLKDGGDAWLLRAKPRDAEVVKVYAGWPRPGEAFVRVSVSKSSTAASVLTEVLSQLDRQEEDVSSFSLLEVCMSSKQVQRQTLTPQEKILDKLQEIRKLSLRQMNQTRFYVVENRNRAVQVNLLIGGLPPLLAKEEYAQLIQEHLTIKSHLVTISHFYPSQGAVALQISCFSEAERIYMLAKDTSVSSKSLTSLVIPEIVHNKLGGDVCPLLVFVNPKSGVCNFMCHEKCLKTLRSVCSCMTPSAVRVPVAHCFGPAGQKKRFCCVCRKQTEGSTALRCEVCELHIHADCAAFSCADCRSSHLDGTLEQDTFHHHWREGNLASAARCEVCRRSCGSSDVLAGMRCEWCGITSHAACYLSMPPECTLGRLRSMLLHPACVRLDSRNFSKMHCYCITESCSHDLHNSGGPLIRLPRCLKTVRPPAPESGKVPQACLMATMVRSAATRPEAAPELLPPDEPSGLRAARSAACAHSLFAILNRNGGPTTGP